MIHYGLIFLCFPPLRVFGIRQLAYQVILRWKMTLIGEHGDGGVVHNESTFDCNFKCKMQTFFVD